MTKQHPARETVILDTNVYLSALGVHQDDKKPAHVIRQDKAISQECVRLAYGYNRVVSSSPVLDELEHMLKRYSAKMDNPLHRLGIVMLARQAEEFVTSKRIKLCLDRDDNKFLDLALASQARYLVTRDRKLLEVDGHLPGLRIIEPNVFNVVHKLNHEGGKVSCTAGFNDLIALVTKQPFKLVPPSSKHACRYAGITLTR